MAIVYRAMDSDPEDVPDYDSPERAATAWLCEIGDFPEKPGEWVMVDVLGYEETTDRPDPQTADALSATSDWTYGDPWLRRVSKHRVTVSLGFLVERLP